ncbi:MAG TPA: hypothetical protein VJZ71_01680 [Phycisphaerae bacterium]|nr:hypothetical protein [Phycisphaerae bacterium]
MKCPSCKSPSSPVTIPWPMTVAGGGFVVQCSSCQAILGFLPNLASLETRLRAIEQRMPADLVPSPLTSSAVSGKEREAN